MNNKKSRVIIRSVKKKDLQKIAEELLAFCDWESIVKKDAKVVIKPNLCTNEPRRVESANTSVELLEAVCKVLMKRTSNITIGESDGIRFPAESAFANTGVIDVAKRLNIQWANLSKGPFVTIDHKIFNKYKTLMPKMLICADVLINMPVIKTHALTIVSGAVKNLWGCVPRHDRIIMHRYLDELLSDLLGILKPQINIMDGIVCVQGRGPTNGIPRRMDLVVGSCDPVAIDSSAMRLVGLDPYTSRHLVLAYKNRFGEIAEENITIDGPFENLKVEFIPPICDLAVIAMNYFTRYEFFVYHILLNDSIFKYAKKLTVILRKLGILNDKPKKPHRRYLSH